jgi:hypothetical protein
MWNAPVPPQVVENWGSRHPKIIYAEWRERMLFMHMLWLICTRDGN